MKTISKKLIVMRIRYLIIFALIAFLTGCNQSDTLNIVRNNDTAYEIVLPENPDEHLKKAGSELQSYLEQITSVTLPIVRTGNETTGKKKIILRSFPWETDHAIHIKNEGDTLVIGGGSSQSTLYAAYEFLEQYAGCKWYSPEVEKIPSIENFSLKKPVKYHYTPEITTRTVHSRLFYENPDFADKLRVTHEAFPGYVPTARVHTFHRLLPERFFYEDHPEYYAWRNGKRLPTQLCLTNEEVLAIVKDSVRTWFERNPDEKVISVSQDDNTLHCQCQHCQKVDEAEGSPAGTMIRFVNEVAEEFPGKTISTLAYQYTRKPPQTKPADNVLITLCSIECDRSGPIEEKCTAFADDLKGWKKLTDNIRIWDYTTQFTNFLAPFPNIHTLQPNIRFFRDNHAKWIFEQHSHHPSELFELRSYFTAKLLWNPDLDEDKVMNEFMNGYYEEAGPFVQRYVDKIHEAIQEDPDFFLFLYGDPAQAFNSFLKPSLLQQYNQFFNQAEEAVKDKPHVLQRVKKARLSTDYAMLEMARNGSSEDFQLLENGAISEKTQMRLQQFKNTCKKAGITLMNEMGYTVGEYLDLYEKNLERAQMLNLALHKEVTLLTQPKKYADEDPQTLTDGALGGANFYADWLGFERNNLEAVIDLEGPETIDTISVGFLQVTNHIVFFPENMTCYYSNNRESFKKLETVPCPSPLSPESKRNSIEYFTSTFQPVEARYIKIVAKNRNEAPVWHNAAGSPAWIFADEVIVN